MRIIHIVSSINSTNFGIWHAAIFGSNYLRISYSVESELWVCTRTNSDTIKPEIPFFYFENSELTQSGIRKWLMKFDIASTIIVTHGAWLKPTFIGYWAKKIGFKWIYLSHGMFEPWALQIGRIKKKLYMFFFEGRMCSKADIIRAVSHNEEINLRKLFNNRVILIRNGIALHNTNSVSKPIDEIVFLFLARLHHKKGILPLVLAWSQCMINNKSARLLIVGPDEGELLKITPYITGNIEYLGPLFGIEKQRVYQTAHYYLLPSYSEGFPTTVVEAMSYGVIPVISEGCNFNEVFEENLGYKITTDKESICNILIKLGSHQFGFELSKKNISYVENNLSENVIGDELLQMYKEVLRSGDRQ